MLEVEEKDGGLQAGGVKGGGITGAGEQVTFRQPGMKLQEAQWGKHHVPHMEQEPRKGLRSMLGGGGQGEEVIRSQEPVLESSHSVSVLGATFLTGAVRDAQEKGREL